MSTDAASLPDDMAQLQATSAQQLATIAALQRELDGLKHFVAQLLRQRYGRKSERIDPAQLALFEAPVQEAPAAASQTPSPEAATTIVATPRRRGGRGPLPPDLPRQRVEHDLSATEKCCPGCGQPRQRIGCETSEQLEFVPASLYVIEHVRWKYACRACQEHVALAPRPTKPLDKALPAAGLLAAVAVGK